MSTLSRFNFIYSRMHLMILCLLLALSHSHDEPNGIKVKAFYLSPPMHGAVPAPPLCDSPNPKANPVTTHVVFQTYIINTTIPIMNGYIVWREKIRTSCTMYFFGAQVTTITNRELVSLSIEELNQISFGPQSLGEIVDLSTETMFKCHWPGTTEHSTTRMFLKSVEILPSLHEGIMADGLLWRPIVKGVVYTRGRKLLKVSSIFPAACPLIEQLSATGFLSHPTPQTSEISCPNKNLQFSFSHDAPTYACAPSKGNIYISDLGFFVEIKKLAKIIHKELPIIRALMGETSHPTDLIPSEVHYDLKELSRAITNNHYSVSRHLCKLRQVEWKRIMKDRDADAMATYLTGDEFAIGKFQKGTIQIQTRLPMAVEIPLEHFHLERPNTIKCLINNTFHTYDSISGLIDLNRPISPETPPVVLLMNNSYLNLNDHRIAREDFQLPGYDPQIRNLYRMESLWTEVTGDHESIIPLKAPNVTTWFGFVWSWLCDEYMVLKMSLLGTLSVLILLVIILVRGRCRRTHF
ncbi:glycoprotein [hymenopteran rhabdo-related virus 109]|uniref:Glycoprotein n=1 Tax=hymenopteran rhabdo-related virus 109 TaxID=2847803 RepID=A0A7D7EXS2_9RHAB|nr:glycoprotein [hymenopteran rhabdo-related virus 109]QMP82143.1 glycoprotein [hymenopteran rhabdo-related virus 109]